MKLPHTIACFFLLAALACLTASNAPAEAPKSWKAILKLEGKAKNYTFTSEAVYGGYNPGMKNIFLFGKNHMFLNAAEPEAQKVFQDLCTNNAMQQFQFEVTGISSDQATPKAKVVAGNISFKKKQAISASFRQLASEGHKKSSIETRGDLKQHGYQFTPEAEKIFTGNYTLSFISSH